MAGTRTLNPKEEAAVYAALQEYSPRDQALLTILAHCGYRVSETLSLNVGDVWEAGKMRPRVKVQRARRKAGKSCYRHSISSRSVPLNRMVTAALEKYLFSRYGSAGPSNPEDPLFKSRQAAHRLSRWQANRVVHAVFRVAGVGLGCGPGELAAQSLRKLFCRRVHIAGGRDILITMAAIAHKSPNTTIRYLQVEADEVDQAMLALAGAELPARAEIARAGEGHGATA